MENVFGIGCMVATIATALSTVTTHAAVVINFDSYADGEVVNQPSGGGTKWAGSTGDFVVGAASGGGKELSMTTGAVSSHTTSFTPSFTELGAASATPTESQSFSFDYRILASNAAGGDSLRIYVGTSTSAHAAEILLRANSVALNGAELNLATGLTLGSTYTISGVIDFATTTYDIAIRNSSGTVLNSLSNRAFDGTTPAAYAGFRLNLRDSGANDRVALDNMTMSVPEPTSLAALGALAMLSGRRRRVR